MGHQSLIVNIFWQDSYILNCGGFKHDFLLVVLPPSNPMLRLRLIPAGPSWPF